MDVLTNVVKFKTPNKVYTIDEMFGAVKLLDFENVVVIVNDADGVEMMTLEGTTAERVNWLLDRAKLLLHKAN